MGTSDQWKIYAKCIYNSKNSFQIFPEEDLLSEKLEIEYEFSAIGRGDD